MPVDETECVKITECIKIIEDGEWVCLHCKIDLRPLCRPKSQASISRRAASRRPALAHLVVLAHQIDEVLANGKAASYVEVARQLGLTRARLTQIMNLLMLAPDIQERILVDDAAGLSFLTERAIRAVLRESDWTRQREVFAQLLGPTRPSHDATS